MSSFNLTESVKNKELKKMENTINEQVEDYKYLLNLFDHQSKWYLAVFLATPSETIAKLFKSKEQALNWSQSLGLTLGQATLIMAATEPDKQGQKAINFVQNVKVYLSKEINAINS